MFHPKHFYWYSYILFVYFATASNEIEMNGLFDPASDKLAIMIMIPSYAHRFVFEW